MQNNGFKQKPPREDDLSTRTNGPSPNCPLFRGFTVFYTKKNFTITEVREIPLLLVYLGSGVNGQNSEGMCQGGKPGTGKFYTDVCLCCSAHTSVCVVDGLGATAAF